MATETKASVVVAETVEEKFARFAAENRSIDYVRKNLGGAASFAYADYLADNNITIEPTDDEKFEKARNKVTVKGTGADIKFYGYTDEIKDRVVNGTLGRKTTKRVNFKQIVELTAEETSEILAGYGLTLERYVEMTEAANQAKKARFLDRQEKFHKATLDSYNENIKIAEQHIADCEVKIAECETKISANEIEIARLESENDDLSKYDIPRLAATNKYLSHDIEEYRAAISGYEGTVAGFKTKIAECVEEYETWKAEQFASETPAVEEKRPDAEIATNDDSELKIPARRKANPPKTKLLEMTASAKTQQELYQFDSFLTALLITNRLADEGYELHDIWEPSEIEWLMTFTARVQLATYDKIKAYAVEHGIKVFGKVDDEFFSNDDFVNGKTAEPEIPAEPIDSDAMITALGNLLVTALTALFNVVKPQAEKDTSSEAPKITPDEKNSAAGKSELDETREKLAKAQNAVKKNTHRLIKLDAKVQGLGAELVFLDKTFTATLRDSTIETYSATIDELSHIASQIYARINDRAKAEIQAEILRRRIEKDTAKIANLAEKIAA